jgi:hypothetical protein
MATRRPTEETVERKRVSIPKADVSVLEWWGAQNDVAQSIRILIRGEIEKNGVTDVAFRPVTQAPRRGRPAIATDDDGADEGEQGRYDAPAPVVPISSAPHAQTPQPAPAPPTPTSDASVSLLSDIMGG